MCDWLERGVVVDMWVGVTHSLNMFSIDQPTSYAHFGLLALVTTTCLLSFPPISTVTRRKTCPRRHKLPPNLIEWRRTYEDDYKSVWNELRPLLEQHGFRLWRIGFGAQIQDGPYPQCDNFLYIAPKLTQRHRITRFITASKGHRHAARMNGVRDVVIRAVTAGGQGHTHLRIIRRLSSPPDILMSNNHFLPILYEIVFEDIVLIVSPKLVFNMHEAIDERYKHSVEDILWMMLQVLEGTSYLHRNLIAHRDLFLNNFLVEWLPQSLIEERAANKPRVYIIDLETAVDFPEQSLPSERTCTDLLVPLEKYGRPVAPELLLVPQAYCPFRLDMWQLGIDLHNEFPTGISEVDQMWTHLAAPKPEDRPTADEAFKILDDFLRRTPPQDLHRRMILPEGYEST